MSGVFILPFVIREEGQKASDHANPFVRFTARTKGVMPAVVKDDEDADKETRCEYG